MDLKGITSFEEQHNVADLNEAADALLTEYSMKRFVLYGKRLTDELKSDISENISEYKKNGQITVKPVSGVCLECGNRIQMGNLYAGVQGEGELLCFDCCGQDTVLSDEVQLFLC